MNDNAWIGVIFCVIFAFSGWWIGHTTAATTSWQVVADGPDTWAVIQDYGSTPYWTVKPGQTSTEQNEIRICKGVPNQGSAQLIARMLNEHGDK